MALITYHQNIITFVLFYTNTPREFLLNFILIIKRKLRIMILQSGVFFYTLLLTILISSTRTKDTFGFKLQPLPAAVIILSTRCR